MGLQRAARLSLVAVVVSTVSSVPFASEPTSERPESVLIVIADDLGVADVAAYGVGAAPPATPALDALAARGVTFTNAWSYPICSPTRATIQTGRYGFRNGIGGLTSQSASYGLSLEEVTMPELLDRGTGGAWSHALFGKWHLGGADTGGAKAPNRAGWGRYAGALDNLDPPWNYWSHERVVDGAGSISTSYVTTEEVDDAIRWIEDASGPWLCVLSFHAPHYPYHAPPAALHSVDLTSAGDPAIDPRPYYEAMVEAMDTELGRLLATCRDELANTTIVFLADNGTPPDVVPAPFDPGKSKNTLFQGGVNVPFIVAGPRVASPGRTSEALVTATDLFSTVAQIAGVVPETVLPEGRHLDSRSLVPLLERVDAPAVRTCVLAEKFVPNGPGAGDPIPPPPRPYVCQEDLGYGGPGIATLQLCGRVLADGNTTDLLITGAPASARGVLAVSFFASPYSIYGGTVVPLPAFLMVPFYTDSLGQLSLPGLAPVGAFGMLDLYLQAAITDPALMFGYSLTNAVRVEMLPKNSKAIRDDRFKLIASVNGGPEQLYDLSVDPFETVDLMAGGAPRTAEAAAAYGRLRSELDRLVFTP